MLNDAAGVGADSMSMAMIEHHIVNPRAKYIFRQLTSAIYSISQGYGKAEDFKIEVLPKFNYKP